MAVPWQFTALMDPVPIGLSFSVDAIDKMRKTMEVFESLSHWSLVLESKSV
jgi:hypothetical protein